MPHAPAAEEPQHEAQRVELAQLIDRFAPEEGINESMIAALALMRGSLPSPIVHTLYRPALCIMAQGRKEVRLADELFDYDPLNYLVVSVSMPLSGRVVDVSPEAPILALRLDIDPAEITALIADAGPLGVPARPTGRPARPSS